MFGQPVGRVGIGSGEDSARQLLDTVASVAADPEGYKARLAALDAATAKSLERETAARQAERAASDARQSLVNERQALEAEQKRLIAQIERAQDEIRRARAKHDAIIALDKQAIETQRAQLQAATDEANKLIDACKQRELLARDSIQTANAEADRNRMLNAELERRTAAADAREAKAARMLERARSLINDVP